MTEIEKSALPPSDFNPSVLEDAFKQFSLETSRLEQVYQKLQDRFKSLQNDLHETSTKLYGKLAELDFVTHYLDNLLDHLSQGIVFIDLNGIITTYNQAAEDILGIKREEVLLHSAFNYFADSSLGFSFKQSLKTQECPKHLVVTWRTPLGDVLELEIETTFVTARYNVSRPATSAPFSPIQGLLLLIRNVTEIRRLQVLTQRYDRLKDLGEMAALVAHEIRNPLGGIKGFATLLHQDLQERPDLQQMTGAIIEGTESLNRFVSRVLNYTRPFQPHLESQDLVLFIREMLQLIQADQNSNARIQYQFMTTLSSLNMLIDPALLKSAVLNMLMNAVQAMPNGGELKIILDQTRTHAILKICDTGIGIPPEHLSKLFSPFFTTKDKGNGFGLAEVHKVVQVHQGTIEVSSEVNKGTIFTIQLPLHKSG